MNKLHILAFLLILSFPVLLFAQSREEKLEQLRNREDVIVTEMNNEILKLEYPNGKVLYKNIADYRPGTKDKATFSPTFDSTIIDLRTIDTTLYSHKYKFWKELPISSGDFDFVKIDDVNNNGKPELYGFRKFFTSDFEPVAVYEVKSESSIDFIYQYDTLGLVKNIFDVDNDEMLDVQGIFPGRLHKFYSKTNDTSLAVQYNFTLSYTQNYPLSQVDDPTLGDFDKDDNADLVFNRNDAPDVLIMEYNSAINNFDSVYRYHVTDPIDLGIGGFSVGDFDLDDKTDIVFSTIYSKVFVVENEGDNQYSKVWQGSVESYNAYIHTWTNDVDGNGKPEFWVLADSYFSGTGVTRITIFESDGDNSYQVVGRVDLVGVFSFYAGNMQAVDIDKDGIEEVAICIDGNFLILKFIGGVHSQMYELYYLKQPNYDDYEGYYGSILNDIDKNGNYEILLTLYQDPPQLNYIRHFTSIYKPDSLTNIGINDELVPEQYKLYQNYPNPFNPVTKIKYEIPDQSAGGGRNDNVKLKVYDVLGNEVATLVNEYKPAGSYEVEFNASALTSGIYFYRLRAGNYVETKKMLLVK